MSHVPFKAGMPQTNPKGWRLGQFIHILMDQYWLKYIWKVGLNFTICTIFNSVLSTSACYCYQAALNRAASSLFSVAFCYILFHIVAIIFV